MGERGGKAAEGHPGPLEAGLGSQQSLCSAQWNVCLVRISTDKRPAECRPSLPLICREPALGKQSRGCRRQASPNWFGFVLF